MKKLLFIDRITDTTILSLACLRELMTSVAARRRLEGQELPRQLGAGRQLMLITSGIARVYVTTDDGRDITQYFARAEDFIVANLGSSRGEVERVEATTDLAYLTLPFSKFEALLAEYPELSTFYSSFLLEQHVRHGDRVGRRKRGDEVDTYASFLKAYPGLENQVPTVHLASFLGLSPEAFLRARQRFRDRQVM